MNNFDVETHCNASLHASLQQENPKFRGKYRIESARLKDWDYSANGAYFITICAKNRKHFFGEIAGETMQLSEIGEIVVKEWENTQQIRSNVEIDEWIVMPNHLHGIVIINRGIVETHCNASLHQNRFGPQSNNLASIIRGFKGATTKNIHIARFTEFAWQSRFYDYIIRDENELNRIRGYIKNNPINWANDPW